MASMNDLVAQNSGSLPDRVASLATTSTTNMDLVQQLVQLQSQQEGILKSKAELPSTAESAGSLQSILGLLVGGAGLAAGNEGLAAGGAGLAQGFVQGQQTKVAQEAANLDQVYDQTQKMLESNRQRLTTMLQSRPEMFIDPVTGKSLVDPRLLGYASTGMVIPINPGAAWALERQTASQKMGVEFGVSMMLNGDTPQKRTQGGMIVSNALGLKLQPEFFEALETQDENGAWISIVGLDSVDTDSALRAMLFAKQNGKLLADPEVVGMLRPALKDPNGTPTIPAKVLSLIDEMNKAIAQTGGALQGAPLEEQIDFVFGNERSGDNALLKNHLLGDDAFGTNLSGAELVPLLASVSDGLMTLATYMPGGLGNTFFKNLGITDENSLFERTGAMVESLVLYNRQAIDAAAAQQGGFKLRQLADKYADDGADYGDASNRAALEIMDIRAKNTNDVGRLDLVGFNKDFTTLLLEGK